MKDSHTVGKKWPKMVVKKPFTSIIHFYSDYKIRKISQEKREKNIFMKHKIPHTSVQPKPSFGIGNRNQCQISVPYFRDLWTLVDQKNLCTLVDQNILQK